MAKHTVIYGEKQITFELKRKNVKNINLRIRPDMSIWVSANKNVPLEVIEDFVKQKGAWICKNLKYFKEFQPNRKIKREYVSGESFRYLGRQYRLKVRKAGTETVKYFRGFIYLYVKDPDDIKGKEKLYKQWLNERAVFHFNKSLDRIYETVRKYNIPKPEIKIREMKSRWGSCHRDAGLIVLNSELIKTPKHCIDYVVLHELIHFKFKYHDNEFYTFLTSLMPDWKKWKKILDEEVIKGL
ncbi:MAG: M48 family metallopeptidase [Caldicoprobacterales bacterium]|nr:M48 family metallopeptidase [Clostridiaceae bacterium]HHU50155.1 M48 family metallopeptidase [Clostridiales bacterium]